MGSLQSVDFGSNSLTDDSIEVICSLLAAHRIEYMSLSDNFFTCSGAIRLLEFLGSSELYVSHRFCLRLDFNLIDIIELAKFLKNDEIVVCFCENHECMKAVSHSRRSLKPSRTLHLPDVLNQRSPAFARFMADDILHFARKGFVASRVPDNKSVDFLLGVMRAVASADKSICRSVLSHPKAVRYDFSIAEKELTDIIENNLPQVLETNLKVFPSSPDSVSSYRMCGLDMRCVAEGYRIIRKTSGHDQPEIQAGDTIVSIEGIKLAGLQAEEMRMAFLSHMKEGARIGFHSRHAPAAPSHEKRVVERVIAVSSFLQFSGKVSILHV